MGCWAIVPIKAAAACKTRLAHVLGPDRREGLARRMLVQVVEAALAAPAIERVLVVSPEQHALPPGVVQLQDIGCGLNEALELARGYARAAGATQLAVLAADLPWLTAADIGTLVGAAAAGEMALACDRHGPGTNAVCLDALLPFVFAFGAGSAARHAAEAARRGLRVRRVAAAGLQFDIDTGADLEWLQRRAAPRWPAASPLAATR